MRISKEERELRPSLRLSFLPQAGQSCEVETLTPLIHRCNKLILVGDPKQLPPTVISMVRLFVLSFLSSGRDLGSFEGVFLGSLSLICRDKWGRLRKENCRLNHSQSLLKRPFVRNCAYVCAWQEPCKKRPETRKTPCRVHWAFSFGNGSVSSLTNLARHLCIHFFTFFSLYRVLA